MSEPDVPPAEGPDTATPPAGDPERRRRRRALTVVLLSASLLLVGAGALDRGWHDGLPLVGDEDEAPEGAWTLLPYRGLGAWVDVYDWTHEFTNGAPRVGLADIDAMAEAGVQTLFLQTGHNRSADDVLEPERLAELIERAHERDLHVVAWYLPTFTDVERDVRRLLTSAELPVDGLAVDIEAVDLAEPFLRSQRLLEVTDRLRAEVGDDKVLGAITLTPLHLDVINTRYWPGYPWADLAERYDVVLPMAYWSLRTGELRSGERYVGENLDRLRAHVGPDVPLHPIGGIADAVTAEDLAGMVQAILDRGAIGGGLYDWDTSTVEQWAVLAPLRPLRDG